MTMTKILTIAGLTVVLVALLAGPASAKPVHCTDGALGWPLLRIDGIQTRHVPAHLHGGTRCQFIGNLVDVILDGIDRDTGAFPARVRPANRRAGVWRMSYTDHRQGGEDPFTHVVGRHRTLRVSFDMQ
jgi:hypothetical protein